MTDLPKKKSVKWKSPSNIALVKYWGKHGNQLPMNPSLSITLDKATTTTEFIYTRKKDPGLTLKFRFEGKEMPAFGERILKFLRSQVPEYPFLNNLDLEIQSSNTFPHSSGIASSASAFSALALCVVSVFHDNEKPDDEEFLRESSRLARLGSGSASRSVYGGYVVWGAMKGNEMYSDDYACRFQGDIHTAFSQMQDAILIVNAGKKKIGSSAGHALMNGHPFAEARTRQALDHIEQLHKVLPSGDVTRFVDIVENEALSLHGLMLSSSPGYFLFEQHTIDLIREIREYRQASGLPVCFTLDAGPNVHLLYPAEHSEPVRKWISGRLSKYCHHGRWIDDGIGAGPERLS
jgi:diphosphomevalonate decarboxylase